MGGSSTVLSIVIQAIDDASAQIEGIFNGVQQQSTSAQEAVTQLGVQMTVAGAAMAGIGEKITDAFTSVVDAATSQQEAQSALATTVANQLSLANQGTTADAGAASEKQFLIDKINSYQAAIVKANADLQNYSGTTAEVAARQASASAALATAQDNLAKYQGQLSQLENQQALAGQSATTLTAALEAVAQSGVNLGFSFTDSLSSLKTLFTETGSVSESQQAFSVAMDLARFKSEDLSTATQQVEMALQGQGRSLATLGIQIKDGLTPMQALQALQAQLNGQAQDYADTVAGKEAIAQAQFNQAMANAGATILPILAQLLTLLTALIQKVEEWTSAHPKLTEVILIAIAVFGGLMLALGSILLVVGPLLIAFATMGGVVAVAIAGIAVGIAILAGVVLANLNTIKSIWNDVWQWVSDFLKTIWNGITSFFQTQITQITNMLQSFETTVMNIFKAITAPISAITGAVSGVVGSVAASIPKLAAGGIVSSPTLALIGEAGPEAVIPLSAFSGGSSLAGGGGLGSGGGITININGGSYLDQGGATMIANALATQIGRQLKLTNFF